MKTKQNILGHMRSQNAKALQAFEAHSAEVCF